MKKLFSFLLLLSFLSISCYTENYKGHIFQDVTIIRTTDVSATVQVTLMPLTEKIVVKGVCWGTEVDPDIFGDKTVLLEGSDAIESPYIGIMTNLKFYQIYYIRAYITTRAGTMYSDLLTFYR